MEFIKVKIPHSKSEMAYAKLKAAVQGLVNAAADNLPFATVITQLKATPPAGWSEADITEGLIKQVAQDLNLPHA